MQIKQIALFIQPHPFIKRDSRVLSYPKLHIILYVGSLPIDNLGDRITKGGYIKAEEVAAYDVMWEDLLKTHEGKFVAIHNYNQSNNNGVVANENY